MLVRRLVVRTKQFRRRVLHQIDRRQRVRAGGLRAAEEREVGLLERGIFDGFVTA